MRHSPCLRLQCCLLQLPQATTQQRVQWPSCAGSQLALVYIPARDAVGPRSWSRHSKQWHKYCWRESGTVCQWAMKIGMGKGSPWGSLERVDIGRGSVGTGCSLCLRHVAAMCATSQHLPHHRGSDLPAGAGAENSLPQGGLLAHPSPCCLYGWDLTGGGTGIDFCASLCNFPCFQCLHGAGTGAKS